MKVGDLVKYGKWFGVVTCIDPEEVGDSKEVEVTWHDGDVANHSMWFLEAVNANPS